MKNLITVNSLLISNFFEHYTVLAGHNGLSNPIRYATVMELQDGANWLLPETVVLTVGSNFSSDTAALSIWLTELASVGVSAVLIKLGRFLDVFPQEASLVADQLGLPIISIPADANPAEITNTIYDLVYSNRDLSTVQHFFLLLLYSSDQKSKKSILRSASLLNINLEHPYYIFYFFHNTEKYKLHNTLEYALMHLRKHDPYALAVTLPPNDHFLIYHPHPAKENSSFICLEPDTIIMAEQIATLLEERNIKLYISKRTTGITNFKMTFEQVCNTANFCNIIQYKTTHPVTNAPTKFLSNLFFSQKLGYLNFLSSTVVDPAVAQQFLATNLMEGLSRFSPEKQQELIETLSHYLVEGGHINTIAKLLHVHKNTVLYRLQSIEKSLSCDLKDVHTRVNLSIALTLYHYFENSGPKKKL